MLPALGVDSAAVPEAALDRAWHRPGPWPEGVADPRRLGALRVAAARASTG